MKVELIEKAAQIVGDNQLLVNIVSKRVQQLNRGADPYIVTTPEMQSGDIALTEIIEGKLVWHEMTEEELAATRQTSQEDPFAAAAAEELHARELQLQSQQLFQLILQGVEAELAVMIQRHLIEGQNNAGSVKNPPLSFPLLQKPGSAIHAAPGCLFPPPSQPWQKKQPPKAI